ncbi:NAD(P)/FAD-dependent oxidoreductase [Iamia sp. SCSIO 61187]|uniref:type III sulfide quinone reductase, selenoprotein subtype n=1 Tax=Iamia sp. SCSIO 61187 TaxID=2722752 RepID=UPI001C62C415|nr:FAD/NAD(P)-binding oxidoreductase [Iamia sp. SCSIO 61187]QYG93523.1 NAD(P)/FAD-dependent oxidoreductase [Iamia sp. SCSIO 61187]
MPTPRQHIVVLGGGTGGTSVANRLRRELPADEVTITVVDQDDRHVYQPGLLFVPFGLATARDLVRPRRAQLHRGVGLELGEIDQVGLDPRVVRLDDGTELPYDVLVVATGARLLPEETEGLTGPGWRERVFTFYDLAGASALAGALAHFDGGRMVIDVADLPIKCPVAPLELAFLADWFFRARNMRDDVEIVYATPLDAAFTRPVAARTLGGLLEQKGIELVTDFNLGSVDGEAGTLVSYDDRTLDFDLAVVVPLHGGAAFVDRTPGLGDELGFVRVDHHTLQSAVSERIFAVGDAAAIPASKAGSVAHYQGEVVVENVRRVLDGEPPTARFDGHTTCFIESGFGRALLIDFDYETEPLPGHYPGRMGLPLLKESWLNHVGKQLFEPLYWHSLLPGRDVPGLGSAMPRAGKALAAASPD